MADLGFERVHRDLGGARSKDVRDGARLGRVVERSRRSVGAHEVDRVGRDAGVGDRRSRGAREAGAVAIRRR